MAVSQGDSILSEAINNYNDANCSKQIRMDLNVKVEDLIKQSKLETIKTKLNELDNKKVGFFGKILGKDKELELQKEQLRLQKEILESRATKKDEDRSANDIMAKILSYQKQNNGVIPEELSLVATQMGKVFKIDNDVVRTKVESQLTGGELVLYGKRESLFRRNTNIMLQQQNEKLKQELQEIKQNPKKSFREQGRYIPRVTDSVRVAYSQLKNISNSFNENNEYTRDEMDLQQ